MTGQQPRLRADVFFPASYGLAESPLWQAETGTLSFVDIDAGNLHQLDASRPRQARTLNMGDWLSAIAPTDDGRLLAACSEGLVMLDPITGARQLLLGLPENMAGHRFNDGKGDRTGRFLVGSMGKTAPRSPTGVLYSISGQCQRELFGQLRTPNSLCFSPDGTTLYACDTADGAIWAFDYDGDSGTASNRRVLAPVEIAPGKPDGATIDADGCIWSARYNGGAVVRITTDGRLDRVVELPVSQITSCTFGGPRLDTLFITTARQNLSAEALAQQPLAGSVFAVEPGQTGLPETPFSTQAISQDVQ